MINDNLIKTCSCSNNSSFLASRENDIDLLVCTHCGTPHQYLPGWTQDKVIEYYKNLYHTDAQQAIGHQAYKDRYEHDLKIANIRLNSYTHLTPGMIGLDIGSSNSAFVHAARARGITCIGIEPGKDIGDDATTIRQPIQEVSLPISSQDFITMHDSLEHMVDIRAIVGKIQSLLKIGGNLIVDIPDYFVPEGLHHWRPVQHLWYWNEQQMINLLKEFGLTTNKVIRPIPGKIVFYATLD
jgi:hypothetical protein